jgi:hypothetical protein
MKRLLVVMSGLVMVWVGVFVIRETAQIVTLAAMVHPRLGDAVLALLLLIYGVCLGLPVVLYFRLPPPLRWPADGSAEAIGQYRQRLADRLSQNPVLKEVTVQAMDPSSLERACRMLSERAQVHITQTASMVFLSTAVSQTGRFDAGVPLSSEPKRPLRSVHPRKLVEEISFRDQIGAEERALRFSNRQMNPNNSYRKELSCQNRHR